jgi:hypothetical protein
LRSLWGYRMNPTLGELLSASNARKMRATG